MLLLTRKPGEIIIINNEILVKVVRMHSRQVMLGIQAPDGMPVHREEIQRRIEEERLFNHMCYGDKI